MSQHSSVPSSVAASRTLTHKLLALVLGSVFVAGSALAQTHATPPAPGPVAAGGALKGQPSAVTYKQKTSYDFDDDQVEGQVIHPDTDLVTGRSKTHHESLVRPRTTFQPEMLKSVESL